MEDRWLSVDELGKYLGVSSDTVHRWIDKHAMPVHRMDRLWKFKKDGTLSGLLWKAINILRGSVDAADFKTYIFPLLFFKRFSDVYDEEYVVAWSTDPWGRNIYDTLPQGRANEVFYRLRADYIYRLP